MTTIDQSSRLFFCVIPGPLSQLNLRLESTLHTSYACVGCYNICTTLRRCFGSLRCSRSNSKPAAIQFTIKAKPSSQPLMCLSRNTTSRPRLDRSFFLQTAPSTSSLRFSRKLLQRVHRDTVLKCGLVRGV